MAACGDLDGSYILHRANKTVRAHTQSKWGDSSHIKIKNKHASNLGRHIWGKVRRKVGIKCSNNESCDYLQG